VALCDLYLLHESSHTKPTYEGYVQKYYDKTVRFIHKSTEIEKIESGLPEIAFDESYLKALEEKVKSRKEKAANILFTLNRLVLVERHRNPIYESLVDKVERLLELWKEKTRDYEKIYKEGAKVINEINSLSERQTALGFSDLEYSVLLSLEERLYKSDELVKEVKTFLKGLKTIMFSGWINQTTVRKDVERGVRRFARVIKKKHNLSITEMDSLYEKLIENVKNYGA